MPRPRAELRAIGMGPADGDGDGDGGGDVKDSPTIPPTPGMVVPPVADPDDDEGTSGGQLTLGAAYYF